MKVVINFEPLELITACAKIKEGYKNRYDYERPPSGHLDKLISEISKLGMVEIEDYALMISMHDVHYLAYHLPTENDMLVNKKILKIVSLRLNKEVFESYFVSWQKNYSKLDNKAGEKNLFALSNQIDYLDKNVYNNDMLNGLVKRRADELLAEYVADIFDKTSRNIDDIVSGVYSVKPTSVLGINIRKKIYINCSERMLLKVGDKDLCDIVSAFLFDEKTKFYINFISKVSAGNLKNYLQLAELARQFFKKAPAVFDKMTPQIKTKFRMWFSLIDIDKVFGNDERGVFWKARAIENHAINVEKKSSFNMVIMHFERFVATEFIFRGDGPIYIVSSDEYRDKLGKLIVRANSKTELKSMLYENYRYTEYRIEHRGDWRANAQRMINYLK